MAEQGDAQAQYNVGGIYAEGLGVSKNDAEAMSWYRKAADQNFPQKGALAWIKVLFENRHNISSIIRASFTNWRGSAAEGVRLEFDAGVGQEFIDHPSHTA